MTASISGAGSASSGMLSTTAPDRVFGMLELGSACSCSRGCGRDFDVGEEEWWQCEKC